MFSGAEVAVASRSSCVEQRHPRTHWRFFLCSFTQHNAEGYLHINTVMPNAMSDQALLPADVGDLRGSCDFVRLRILPFWMACPRESHPSGDHTIQLTGVERPSVPWRVSTFSSCRARLSVSIVIHGRRIPGEGCVHRFLVDTLSVGLRSAGASIVSNPSFPA